MKWYDYIFKCSMYQPAIFAYTGSSNVGLLLERFHPLKERCTAHHLNSTFLESGPSRHTKHIYEIMWIYHHLKATFTTSSFTWWIMNPPIVGMYCSILFQRLSPHPNNKNPDIPTAWRTSRPFMVMLWRRCKLKRQCSCRTRGWDFHLAHGVEKPTFSRQKTPIFLYLFDGNYVYFLFKGDDICKSTPRNNQTKTPMVY